MSVLLTPRNERMKQREGDRLFRSLRRLFKKSFGFSWTNDETSYFNGKDIFVKYDMQTEHHRTFTDPELSALRYGHGVHEAGHSEYDFLQDYIDWQKEMIATSKEDYLANEKYPLPWLQYFGNMGLDGRMERLIVLKTPSQQPYLDLNNYEWRFGNRFDSVGKTNLDDFRIAYAHRVLGMEDMEEWLEDVVELVNRVQPLIDKVRLAPTTKTSLACVTEVIREVWPTLLTWMDIEDSEPSDDDSFTSDMTSGTWAESAEEAAEHGRSVLERYEPSSVNEKDNEEPVKSNKREAKQAAILRQLEKSLEKDAAEIEQEIAEETHKKVSVTFKGERGDLSATVNELPIAEPSLETYRDSLSKVQRYIKPIAKELRALLEAVPEQTRRNIRSGRFMAGQAWRAIHCEDSHVFSKPLKGTPKEDAFIGCMTDISGSTDNYLSNGVPIYEEMRKGLALLLEASEIAGIPTEAYAFTEYAETMVFRLKPTDAALSDTHRRAIGGIEAIAGNRDTVALKYLLDRTQLRPEGIRLAIMLSDGMPIFENNEGPETISNMVKEAEKSGIDVLCLFIGDHDTYTVDMVKKMYPGRVIAANKGIAKELTKHVKRIIRQRR
ncbi:hypothetical protein V6B14_22135 (plasmid) [Sporosarcina psychrophila]